MSNREEDSAASGLPAGEWLNIFRSAKVEVERLDATKSARGRATIIGNFLARMLNRSVPIEVDGRPGKATLRKEAGRARKQLYYFEVVFEDGQSEPERPPVGNPSPSGGRRSAGRKPAAGDKKPAVSERSSPVDRTPALGLVPAGNEEKW
jgi:hypothetical protein